MKILAIGKYFPPQVGGIETVSQQLCKSLATKGFDINIITLTIPPSQLYAQKQSIIFKFTGFQ